MLTTSVQVRLFNDGIDHLDGIVFVSDHPLDGARDDEALPHHQTLSSPMMKDRGGLLLLIPNRWARPLLGWTVVLGVALSLWGNFRSHLEGHVDASP